jgi:hypothetical protein
VLRDELTCEVCGGQLCFGGRKVTGICARCRSAGAEFSRRWMEELQDQGLSCDQIAEVVGSTGNTVRIRLSERRRVAA